MCHRGPEKCRFRPDSWFADSPHLHLKLTGECGGGVGGVKQEATTAACYGEERKTERERATRGAKRKGCQLKKANNLCYFSL